MILTAGLLSELVYLFLISRVPEKGIFDLHNNLDLLTVILAFFILHLIYLGFYVFLDFKKVTFRQIFLIAGVINITFFIIPFLSSDDIHSYIFQGRVQTVWEANPYLVPFDHFPKDPLYESINTVWSSQTYNHGPLFLIISLFIDLWGQDNLTFLIFLFKFLSIGANLLSLYVIFLISKSTRAAYIYGFNPLIVYELSGNGHNESLLILFLVLSFYFINKKTILGYSLFVLSVLVKFFNFFLMPFYLIYILRFGLGTFIKAIVVGIVICLALFFPFFEGLGIFRNILSYYYGEYSQPSLGILAGKMLFGSHLLSFNINSLIFFVIGALACFKFWRERMSLERMIYYCLILYLIYILTKLSVVRTWYLTPLIALGALCVGTKEFRKWGEGVIFFSIIYSLGLYYLVR